LLRLLQQSRACPEPVRVREDVSEQVAVERDEPGDTLAFFCDPDLGRRDEVAQEAPVLLARVQARQVREHLLAGPCEDLVHAVPGGKEALRVTQEQIDALEAGCDDWNAELAPLRSFVLPGGSELAARLYLARAVCRRAERSVLALDDRSALVAVYLNRLAD